VIDFVDVFVYKDRLQDNVARLKSLMQVFKKDPAAEDVLRAIVVFTYAFLEDFLRMAEEFLLPDRGEEVINSIPLAGLTESGHPEKFLLGKLVKHRGKLIEEVIRESVAAHLEHKSFSSVDSIAILLKNLGVKVADHDQHFARIEEMMQRRHHIVHRADTIKVDGVYKVQPIDDSDVKTWIDATLTFIGGLFKPLFDMENPFPPIGSGAETKGRDGWWEKISFEGAR
jgi:hypothetical protein